MQRKRLLSFVLFLFSFSFSFCQSGKINEVGVATTIIWNKTTIFNSYSGARAKDITGEAVSSGLNLNYSRTIYKNLFGRIGVGIFKQKFGIVRPFDFDETGGTSTNILYSTKYYSYSNFNYFGSLGYNWDLKKHYAVRLLASYNFFDTYRQEFRHDFATSYSIYGHTNPQIREKNYKFGTSIFVQPSIKKDINKNFGIELSLVLPVYNKWRKDIIFREDMNEFYGSNFSIGGILNLIYKFNTKKWGTLGNTIKSVTVSLVARNLFVWAAAKGFDPSELAAEWGENGQLPGTRSYGATLRMGF